MLNDHTSRFVREHGEWTAMSIKLPDGSYTREPRPDSRLKRLVQIATDISKKPLADCRVLDLACLEGHYAIEFGLHGAESLGIEGREINLAKCDYVREAYSRGNISFVQDDVRNFDVQKYGMFDIIICSGILYHLQAEDGIEFIKNIRAACSGILLLDTFVSLHGREELMVSGRIVRGHYYSEHEAGEMKADKLWASLDNERSFWFTEATLMNLLSDAGFTSVADVLVPTMVGNPVDRKTYVAIAGQPASIMSSDPTAALPAQRVPEGPNMRMDASQHPAGRLHVAAKKLLPQFIKDAIKPPLRAVGILPPDTTPEFMKRKKGR